jgi:hypothetical protein
MIKLKKIFDRTQFKGAVWVVVGAEHIRVHQIGNNWLADEYRDGKYVSNIAKSYNNRSSLIKKLAVA